MGKGGGIVSNFFKKEEIKKKYDIGKVLGSGNFAIVKECVEKETGKAWAVKIIDKTKVGDMEESLKTEIDILNMVNHPNIIGLHTIFDESKKMYLVMELVSGGELFDRIVKKGSYSEKDASSLIKQIATAVKYLHELKIVHRDLKPENLMYAHTGDDSDIKIGDFGLAKIVSSDKMMQT